MKIEEASPDITKFMLSLDVEMFGRTTRALDLLKKYEYKLGMPYSKSLGRGLFELRIRGHVHARIIYCFHKQYIYLLNAFIKKTDKIPRKEIDLASKRYKMLA